MRLPHLLVAAISVFGLIAATGSGFVGVHDPCSSPTPYPPPGAGAGVARNPDFEEGFAGGVANLWTAFQSPGYNAQVLAGTDRSYSGSNSQKLILPQPTAADQDAGVYQQIWVVPGETYTASVYVYLEPPAEQARAGEDLVAWLGLDPYGQADGNGSAMVWSGGGAATYRWMVLTTSARAVAPVMTISLKAVRKLPHHGRDARVWFDGVIVTGTVPTGTPPGPEPAPVNPETLIPRTFGANLLANPSFEQAFAGGVSAGWNKWSTAGTGTWRRSLRVGKVGGGRYDCGPLEALAEMNPKTILLYGGTPSATDASDAGEDGMYGDVVELANKYPQLSDTIIVGRPAIKANWETYKASPVFYGRQLADQLWVKQQQFPRIDCWQGLNEPDPVNDWQAALAFEKAFADRAHELGMKVCLLNLASGAPANDLRMVDETFSPSCRDVLAVADYLGQHCQGGPNDDLMVINQSRDDACDYAMRPRRFSDLYARRGWRFPPVIATEGSTRKGWHGNWRPETIASDLTTMGTYMNADRWWCGYANFVVGGSCRWTDFEIAGQGSITKTIGEWNANNPADAVDGLYSQMFGAGQVHPRAVAEATPAGVFTGGVNRQVNGLIPGQGYVVACYMKYEFRGQQPMSLKFHIGVDPTGQTANGNAPTIDWGADQIAEKSIVHETFSHAWRTFTAAAPTASIWLRATQPVADPSFMVYVDNVEVRQLNAGKLSAALEVSPLQIDVTTYAGAHLSPASVAVRNASKVGTLAYSVVDNADWLSVSPTEGTSTSEDDTIALTYDLSCLVPGTHQAVVTVSAPGAAYTPQMVMVNLTVLPVRADFDGDGDVDGDDFKHIRSCLTEDGVPATPQCIDADLDYDGDVDLRDFGLFQNCVSGPDSPAAPTCIP